jgi:hypothetical protein
MGSMQVHHHCDSAILAPAALSMIFSGVRTWAPHVSGGSAVLCLSVTEARNCFDDETGYFFDRELSDQNRPLLDHAPKCRLKRFGRHSK